MRHIEEMYCLSSRFDEGCKCMDCIQINCDHCGDLIDSAPLGEDLEESDVLEEAPDGSGEMWCEACVNGYYEDYELDAFILFEHLKGKSGKDSIHISTGVDSGYYGYFDLYDDDGKCLESKYVEGDDYREVFKDLTDAISAVQQKRLDAVLKEATA